jgi:hypothetical protein
MKVTQTDGLLKIPVTYGSLKPGTVFLWNKGSFPRIRTDLGHVSTKTWMHWRAEQLDFGNDLVIVVDAEMKWGMR